MDLRLQLIGRSWTIDPADPATIVDVAEQVARIANRESDMYPEWRMIQRRALRVAERLHYVAETHMDAESTRWRISDLIDMLIKGQLDG